jgi:hypothetical protein
MADPNTDAMMLRFAMQNLACAPQAQRRYVQLGFMARTVANLNRIAPNLDALVDAGLLDEEQADLANQVQAELSRRLQENPGFLREEVSGPREFLYSHELEGPDWHELRHLARRANSAIVGEGSLFV